MKLQDKVIVITGAARGLGNAIAQELASSGAKIALVDINEEQLQDALQDFEQKGFQAKTYIANVANEDSVISLFENIMADFGQIDGLVNNAGIIRDGMLVKAKDGQVVDTLSLSSWQQVIDVNLTGVFLCGREAAKHMVNGQTQGVLVNISSISRNGNVGQSNYAAAKAGVSAMTTTWAKELARFGIRSAAIAPGFIETEMTQMIKPEILDKIRQTIPLQAMGKPDNIAQTVKFIFENDYISGRTIEVDGALRL
ncbi:SDR family oxidoreductase [Pleionea sp. CnH1-48]|uniref:SDR family oxidoreductase n=1 Tax=Pleionea sp. CnH1-48 TaxID=2954494 RepID=UPI002097CA1D|nr:SDR family oxidoreductase [Pleionea sp. CnH1-48]MCO7227162.1 SDR family oxidoreductase [Pleionea sp. CnH1-48]